MVTAIERGAAGAVNVAGRSTRRVHSNCPAIASTARERPIEALIGRSVDRGGSDRCALVHVQQQGMRWDSSGHCGGGVELPLPQPASEITREPKKVKTPLRCERFITSPGERSRCAVRTASRSAVEMHVGQFFFTTCSFDFPKSAIPRECEPSGRRLQCSGGELDLE